MVLKVLFMCYWICSFPGREGTLSQRWESWLNSHWGCLATAGFCLCGFSPPSAIQYGRMSWSCSGSKSLPLSLTNLTFLAKDALVWCCASHWPGLYLLGEPVATLLLLRNKSWQLLSARVWLFTANFLQFSNSCSPYSRTSVMYCLYFLLDSSPDCFLFSCCQFCMLPDLVRVLIFFDTFSEAIDFYPVIIYFS